MSRVTISSGNSSAGINTAGGLIEDYKLAGRDILYPRREIEGKMRGGSHVCAPYFGPGQTDSEPQHGFGRDVEWRIATQSADSVELIYRHDEGDYAELELKLIYRLSQNKLTSSLVATNYSREQMRLTPGFHPYFVSPSSGTVSLGGRTYHTDQVSEAIFHSQAGAIETARLDDLNVEIESQQLQTIAIWTDRPGEYVCLEPTLAGNSYSEELAGGRSEYLQPGETQVYDFSLTVSVDG